MEIPVKEPCDRCGEQIDGFVAVDISGMVLWTGGFYDMRGWEPCENPGESKVCDSCMHKDPRYLEYQGIK